MTGHGTNPAWQTVEWVPLARVGTGRSRYATRGKALYSTTGIYFLVEAEDERLTCTLTEDFSDLFREDVIEVFLWPDERHPVYFEYEISPLGYELPVLVSNNAGQFCGWLPWHFYKTRKTRLATVVRGGEKQPHAAVAGWTVEFFIPFALLVGLGNSLPQPGTQWRVNLCRIDYDVGSPSHWSWAPVAGNNFHDYTNFGRLVFR